MVATSYYQVLGVAPSCSAEDVRRAYHRAARSCHPDKRPSPASDASTGSIPSAREEQQFLLVQEAYETLRDVELRAQYDAQLAHDALVEKREAEVVVVSEEVPACEMQREELPGEDGDEDEVLLTHRCRCGDQFEITEAELQDGVDVVPCTGCSLHIRVLQTPE